jgi:ribosomal protein S18 acetylase RimI-like enzyme
MIEYRSFRNTDPPGITEVWNSAFSGRGAYPIRNASVFDETIFNKIYFDPQGLIVAVEEGFTLGFVHAGFSTNASQSGLDHKKGVICAVAVKNGFLRLGIGRELIRRAEAYLCANGAETIVAGGMKPNNPFYFGIYGGSDSPGFLLSDTAAEPFFQANGYKPLQRCIIIHRDLEAPMQLADPRFTFFKRRLEFEVVPRMKAETWWQVCKWGEMEPVECRLVEKDTDTVIARAYYWEMVEFGRKWEAPAVGLLDLEVNEGLRGEGLGKYLLYQVLRHLQEQFFRIVEMQVIDTNVSALHMFEKLGFECVDEGYSYEKVVEPTNPSSSSPTSA